MATPTINGTANGAAKPINKLLDTVVREPGRQPSPQPTHLGVPGTATPVQNGHILHETGSGYVAPKFEGKAQQMEEVVAELDRAEFIPEDFVKSETEWFYNALGIDDMYFSTESVQAISSHIHSLWAAKVAAYARGDNKMRVQLDKEDTDHAVYIDTSTPGVTIPNGPNYEQRLESKYLDGSRGANSYRVETFRASSDAEQSIRCYFVYQSSFKNKNPAVGESSIEELGDERFLIKATQNTKAIYQGIMDQVVSRTGPVIDMYDIEGTREKRLIVGFKQGSALGLFSALSSLYHYYGLTSSRKYVEQFSNGITIISMYLAPAPIQSSMHPPIEASIHQIMKEISLLYCIPQNRFQSHFISGRLSLQESIYAHCVWIFTQHFLNRLGNEYNTLASVLDPTNTVHAEILAKLKKRLRNETFTAEYILEIIDQYPQLIRALYLSFANSHYVQTRGDADNFLPTL